METLDSNFADTDATELNSQSTHEESSNMEIVDWDQQTDVRDLELSYKHPDFIVPGC